MNGFRRLSFALCLLTFSGCAIYTPYETCRFWADYNTERQLNAQLEVYDHLPPHTVRVKMMRWGYNVGPNGAMYKGTAGIGTGVWEERLFFWRRWGQNRNQENFDINAIPPNSPTSPTNPPPMDATPILPPPAPPAEEDTINPGNAAYLKSNRSSQRVRTVGHQTESRPKTSGTKPSHWIFTKSTPTESP